MVRPQVSKSEFKARALELFRQVESSGQSLIVTDHGEPTLEIRPYRAVKRSPLELLRGSVILYVGPTAAVGEDEWESSA